MRHLLMLLAAGFALPASAIDINVCWDAVTTYEDDGDPLTLDTLPGTVTYELWGFSGTSIPRLLTTTAGTCSVRPNVTATKHTYYLVTLHSYQGKIERSDPSAQVSKDLSVQQPIQRTSGKPAKAQGVTVEVAQ